MEIKLKSKREEFNLLKNGAKCAFREITENNLDMFLSEENDYAPKPFTIVHFLCGQETITKEVDRCEKCTIIGEDNEELKDVTGNPALFIEFYFK